ncbi:FkbM family methyltransferase [Bradyrhizobium diazoefficiens]|uniref:FkbM family methyltransferase n=1 Tax=Bradyrhizobium diazoefficiens TaxID=1355477 RepID=UPI001B5D08C5|nr:FkbM family methyltransferase [Bradyrhizobium japonicum]
MIAFCLVSSDHGPLLVNRMDYNHTHTGDFYGVGAQIMENGCYDPLDVANLKNLLRWRRKYFGDGVVALDGGANIGVHAVEWARFMRGWGSVLAVEAQERVFYALAGNITLQNCHNARALWAALADVPGELSFPEPDYTQQGSFGSFELKARAGTEYIGQPIDYGQPTSTVRQIMIDGLGLERLDLLKLDLEGMEAEALDGARETIARCRPILFVETIKSDGDAISAALRNEGYRVFADRMNTLAIHETDGTLQHIETVKEAA